MLLNQSCIFHNVREVTAKEVVISRERNKTGSANQSSMDSLVCVTPPHLATAATSVVAKQLVECPALIVAEEVTHTERF